MLPAILLYFIFSRIRHPSKATPGCAAQRRLGEAYEKGEFGLVTDEVEVLKWYTMSAEVGNGYAQWRLGKAYEKNRLGPGD